MRREIRSFVRKEHHGASNYEMRTRKRSSAGKPPTTNRRDSSDVALTRWAKSVLQEWHPQGSVVYLNYVYHDF
jgi:hypothetical protein